MPISSVSEVESEGEFDMEFRAGQVTLTIFDPSSIGQPFTPSPAGLALRVADVAAVRAESRQMASSSMGLPRTPVSVTWRLSVIHEQDD